MCAVRAPSTYAHSLAAALSLCTCAATKALILLWWNISCPWYIEEDGPVRRTLYYRESTVMVWKSIGISLMILRTKKKNSLRGVFISFVSPLQKVLYIFDLQLHTLLYLLLFRARGVANSFLRSSAEKIFSILTS